MKKIFLLSLSIFCVVITAFSQTNNSPAMQQYMLIFRFKSNFVPPSKDAVQNNIRHWQSYMSDLAQSGKLVSGFRPSNLGRIITGTHKTKKDGTYIANDESISSVIIINAISMDEANDVAAKCPIFEFDGSVEIRPLMDKAN